MKRFVAALILLSIPSLVQAQAVIVPSPVPSCSNNDILKWDTATSLFVCATIAGSIQPLSDAIGLIANSSDATKILRFNVAAITTATTRTWTIPDANITVPSTIASLAANTFTGIQTLNAALRLADTDASHYLTVAPGSNLTANRTLTVTTGDADRTVTLSGNPTLNDWFDQSVKAAASPTFNAPAVTSLAASGFVSVGATTAAAGSVRLANNVSVAWRNAANNADLGLALNGSNVFALGSSISVTGSVTASGDAIAGGAFRNSAPADGIFGTIYQRNGANSAYVELLTLDSGSNLLIGGNTGVIVFRNGNGGVFTMSGADLYINSPTTGHIRWLGQTRISSPADGRLLITDDAGTAFGRMQFGGTTSSFPALKRSTTALHVRLADDSAFADLSAATTTITRTALGTTSTDGLVVQNTTAAAAGAQQISPRIRLSTQGWRTDATAESQTVDWALENLPVEGAANPSSTFLIKSQINGGGYTTYFQIGSQGQINIAGNGNITTSTQGFTLATVNGAGISVLVDNNSPATLRPNGDNTTSLGRTANRWTELYLGGFIEGTEQTAPAAPAANRGRVYFEDNGSGKTRLMVIFPSGAAQQIAIEP